MNKQKEYWDKKIKIWSNSSYKTGSLGFNLIEWLAGFFRGPIGGRMEVTLKIVGPKIKDKVIADLGCGVGDFCFRALDFKPLKVIGMDISTSAVNEAAKRAKEKGVANKTIFIQGDLGAIKEFPDCDFLVGSGFIDYLDREQLAHLFKKIKARKFFFSFPEKKTSFINFLQAIYLKTQNCPGAYKYTKGEMKKIIPPNLDFRFIEENKMVFITNL